MKCISALCSAFVIVLLSIAAPTVSHASENPYAPYQNFEELRQAYFEAVDAGNLPKHNELLEIGQSSLLYEMQRGERLKYLKFNEDERYWINQFPKYFSAGYFNIVNGELKLTLVPRGNYRYFWSEADKANGWNAVYTKFHKDKRWKNTEIMKQQFYCHARLGYSYFAGDWDLEPHKTWINAFTCN